MKAEFKSKKGSCECMASVTAGGKIHASDVNKIKVRSSGDAVDVNFEGERLFLSQCFIYNTGNGYPHKPEIYTVSKNGTPRGFVWENPKSDDILEFKFSLRSDN